MKKEIKTPNGNHLVLPGFFIIEPAKVTLIALYTILRKSDSKLHIEGMNLGGKGGEVECKALSVNKFGTKLKKMSFLVILLTSSRN